MTFQILIFDVDGTLANTEEVHRWAFNQVFKAHGLGWHWDEALYLELLKVTGGKERITHYMQRINSELLNRPDMQAFVAGLHGEKTGLYTQRVEKGEISLRPGVERLINEARQQGLTLAIATTTSRANVTSLLTSTLGSESLSWFQVMGTGESAPEKKPHPGVYQYVLDSLGVAPADCMALEDTSNGLKSAKSAGIPVVITRSPYAQNDDFSGALTVTDGLGEPDQPFHLEQGATHGKTYVDVELLKLWHHSAGR